MDAEELRIKLERDILSIIEEKLKNGQMDAQRAKDIARMVLDKLHPPLSLEVIHKIIPTLDDHFTELTTALLPFMQGQEEKIRNIVTDHAHGLIKLGKVEEATTAIKAAL